MCLRSWAFVSSSRRIYPRHAHAGYDVAVYVQGDRHAAVTQNFGHLLGALILDETYRRARVPEIMEPYSGQTAPIQQGLKTTTYEVARIYRRAPLRGKHQICLSVGLAMDTEDIGDARYGVSV